jgi:hypothetical protein
VPVSALRATKFLLWATLGTGFILGQGYLIFLFQSYDTPFASLNGLRCVVVPLLIEAVIGVVTLRNVDQLHANAVANPHSLLGEALRKGNPPPPSPPAAREAWDGHWEDRDQAADRMSGKQP